MLDREILFDWVVLLADYVITSPGLCFLSAGLDGNIHAFNSAMADTLKVSEPQLYGLPVWRFLTGSDAAALRERISVPDAPHCGMVLNFVSQDHRV